LELWQSHLLFLSQTCEEEISCHLVWWKESSDPYEICVVHKGITKQHHCIVKVCGLFFCWLLGCSKSKNMWFLADFRQRAASYQIHKDRSIYFCHGLYSGIDLDYIIYTKYGKEPMLHPESTQFFMIFHA